MFSFIDQANTPIRFVRRRGATVQVYEFPAQEIFIKDNMMKINGEDVELNNTEIDELVSLLKAGANKGLHNWLTNSSKILTIATAGFLVTVIVMFALNLPLNLHDDQSNQPAQPVSQNSVIQPSPQVMPSTIPPFVLPAATGNPYPTFNGAQQTGVELTGQPTTQPAPLPPITQAEREQIQQRVEQQRKSNSDFLKQIEALRQ